MSMLESYAADEVRDLVKRAERSGPIGYRETSIIAGNKRASKDEHKSSARHEEGESVMHTVIANVDSLQR